MLGNTLGEGVRRSIIGNWDQIEPLLVDGSFKDVFCIIAQYIKTVTSQKASSMNIEAAVNNLPNAQKFHKNVTDEFDAFSTKFSTVMKKHAMLGIVDWTQVTAKSVDMIVEYVNFVAKS